MAAVKNTCLLCGKEYDVCKLCPRVKEFTPWKLDFESQRHAQIYAIVQDMRQGILTNDNAKTQLNNLGVTSKEVGEFVPSVQATLKPIMGAAKKAKAVNKESEEKSDGHKAVKAHEEVAHPQEETKTLNPFKGRRR